MTAVIFAVTPWPSNAHMVADVAGLGYLHKDWPTLDPTYGLGNFWKVWRPDHLTASDLHTLPGHVDFRHLPHADDTFRAVTFDGPYKLNGTPTASVDKPYGVDVVATREGRHQLLRDGMTECARVLAPKGYLLVKCMDQVNSGRVWWQTDILTEHARRLALTKVDRFDILVVPRAQPERTRADGKVSVQQHARRNHSSLLIFQA